MKPTQPEDADTRCQRAIYLIEVMQGNGIINLPELLRTLKGQS
ncbi:hypothetical protein AB0284_21535 [Pseudarthrobacter phenanthrenivorans]